MKVAVSMRLFNVAQLPQNSPAQPIPISRRIVSEHSIALHSNQHQVLWYSMYTVYSSFRMARGTSTRKLKAVNPVINEMCDGHCRHVIET